VLRDTARSEEQKYAAKLTPAGSHFLGGSSIMMKVLAIIGLCFLITGCSDGNYNRGYVISKAEVQPEAADSAEK
jgi:hypothetical protein